MAVAKEASAMLSQARLTQLYIVFPWNLERPHQHGLHGKPGTRRTSQLELILAAKTRGNGTAWWQGQCCHTWPVMPPEKLRARAVKGLAAHCTNAEHFLDAGSPPGNWANAGFMPVIPKRGADELGFSVPIILTSVGSEIMEKLIRDSADKNKGGECNSCLSTCGKPRQKSVYL